MDDSQKPFACTVEGCEMTFTNEDHLNWHHKKHDMVLNLGLANKSAEVADQTPTPTRFIRNCEEVGLFQDLQNVNPFDETFKKAIECAKSGTLHVPELASNDDTLHTPHIFPHVESTSAKYMGARNDNQSTQSTDFCIDSVPAINENSEPDASYDLTILPDESVKDTVKTKHDELKNKLKETIQNKVKTPIVITPVPLERLKVNESVPSKRVNTEQDSTVTFNKRQRSGKDIDEKAKIREMNRAAQLRCRKRKQIQWKRMEEELQLLKNENSNLNHENQNFRHKFYALKELLIKHKCNISEDGSFSKVEEILNAPPLISKKSTSENTSLSKRKKSKTSPIVPVALIQNSGQPVQNPLLIQVMGSVQQLAVSVLPNKS
ncbi:cyclic AMP-dependent transcription factor ATF-2 isoform X2 [Zophobas morio]|uniref:cyclic AMP-dependent transcription factor ATF-2 isoform X2 n=1 Tax=Zophobas morio TaxID=2755281 RepID=UPI003082B24E